MTLNYKYSVETFAGVFKKLEKYGFVYIWYDRKHRRYYIGCHWGREDDGYICSSNWMRDSYRRRPEDFKRRVLKTGMVSKQEMFMEEQRLFSMIKREELKTRYYNLNIWTMPWILKNNNDNLSEETKQKMRKPKSEETKQKMSEAQRGKIRSEEFKIHLSEKKTGIPLSEDHKEKISKSLKGRTFSEEHKLNLRIGKLK